MCCRSTVWPLDPEAAEYVLRAGLFIPTYTPSTDHRPTTWERKIGEEGTSVTVSLINDLFALTIGPSISHYAQHVGKRIAAGVYFEIAARYAEKVNGIVTQKSCVSGCYTPGDPNHDRELAHYPEVPLLFDQICPGFRDLIMGEAHGT